jgi:hypothetical protein
LRGIPGNIWPGMKLLKHVANENNCLRVTSQSFSL